MSTALDRALHYAERGLPVFPCFASKAPACPGGFKAASADPPTVHALWRRYPGVLIGVPTGDLSGIAVLDIDPRHGGDEWLVANLDKLAPTRWHATRSGGKHLLYENQPGLRSSAGKIAPGVDVRAEGGFIIWWPAIGLPVENAKLWAPWPIDVTPVREPVRKSLSKPLMTGLSIYGERALDGAVDMITRAPEGQQRTILFAQAASIGELVAGGCLPFGLAEKALIWAASQMAIHDAKRPWRDDDIRALVAEAMLRGMRQPRNPRA